VGIDRRGGHLVGEQAVVAAIPDFNHLDPDIANNPYPDLATLRAGCPGAHSTAHGGHYVVTGYDAVRAAAMDGKTFSTNVDGIGAAAMVAEIDRVVAPLFEADGDPHFAWRHLLQPYFKRAAAAEHEDYLRRLCRETIAEFTGEGRADLVTAYTQRVPPMLIGTMLGLSESEQVSARPTPPVASPTSWSAMSATG
jgi:cytochrome P450